MTVELINYTPCPLAAIEAAASTCYDSEIKKPGAIMRHCYKSGHHSVLEFANFHFHIEGVSRALTHQLVRHRLASFAQRSQRYCTETEDGFHYVTPPSIDKNLMTSIDYNKFMQQVQDIYDYLIHQGVPKEDARFVLPNACESQIDVSMNFRELIHFMNERLCSCAQWEIRELAQKMRQEIIKVFPEAKEYLVPKCEANGYGLFYCTESKTRSCGRHPHVTELEANNE